MTDKAGARKAVLLSAGALLLIAVYRDRQGSDNVNLFKRVWGVSVMALMLAVLADFAPGVAGPFAVLTVLGSLTHGGDAAIQNLLGGLSTGGGGLYGTTGPVGGGTAPAAKTASPTAKVPGETLVPGAQGPQG